MQAYSKYMLTILCAVLSACLFISCKKLVSIPPPKDKLTTTQIFKTDAQAEYAIAGIYSRMINGDDMDIGEEIGISTWSSGLATILGGLSSGEFYNSSGPLNQNLYVFSTSKLRLLNSALSDRLWGSAYQSIYGANAVIEGIATSTSETLRENARKELTGEAKFIRALAFFYLTNFYGDVPLALTIDFNKTASMSRTPQQEVYSQIMNDLKEAQTTMRADYPPDATTGMKARVRPTRLTATALLARVSLYLGDMENAVAAATEVINRHDLYSLETDLNKTFMTNSQEAIWQLKQTDQDPVLMNATPEGYFFYITPSHIRGAVCNISDQLLNSFEAGDRRRIDWLDSTFTGTNSPAFYYPAKYKIGQDNMMFGSPQAEYYVVLRLAEMYLVRAEANARGGPGGLIAAIDDLNIIRRRAGLHDLPHTLNGEQVLEAVAKERQVEFFAEWGHRWLDLKRTGRAADVLRSMPIKQPWDGDHQLLYPIPAAEIRDNSRLSQNPGYF
jgi:hypothetical protein